jgi:hypothetical protein
LLAIEENKVNKEKNVFLNVYNDVIIEHLYELLWIPYLNSYSPKKSVDELIFSLFSLLHATVCINHSKFELVELPQILKYFENNFKRYFLLFSFLIKKKSKDFFPLCISFIPIIHQSLIHIVFKCEPKVYSQEEKKKREKRMENMFSLLDADDNDPFIFISLFCSIYSPVLPITTFRVSKITEEEIKNEMKDLIKENMKEAKSLIIFINLKEKEETTIQERLWKFLLQKCPQKNKLRVEDYINKFMCCEIIKEIVKNPNDVYTKMVLLYIENVLFACFE